MFDVSNNNIHIKDSYQIRKKEFKFILEEIKRVYPDSDVWKRSILSLCLEWACHNAGYFLGIERKRTADVDLEYPQTWYTRLGYFVVGIIVWLFIK